MRLRHADLRVHTEGGLWVRPNSFCNRMLACPEKSRATTSVVSRKTQGKGPLRSSSWAWLSANMNTCTTSSLSLWLSTMQWRSVHGRRDIDGDSGDATIIVVAWRTTRDETAAPALRPSSPNAVTHK